MQLRPLDSNRNDVIYIVNMLHLDRLVHSASAFFVHGASRFLAIEVGHPDLVGVLTLVCMTHNRAPHQTPDDHP